MSKWLEVPTWNLAPVLMHSIDQLLEFYSQLAQFILFILFKIILNIYFKLYKISFKLETTTKLIFI